MTRDLVGEAVKAGARREAACGVLGVSVRTVERWTGSDGDGRHGPKTKPANALSEAERKQVVEIACSPEHRNLSPHQIVPRLVDQGRYVASESTFFRVLRAARLMHHRARSKAPVHRPVPEHTATGPNQVWSWDITYLLTTIRGAYFYLYLVLDIFSRKVVGWEVHERESDELSSALMERIARELGIDLSGVVLHADNGGPMKGSTMLAKLQQLGVVASFSRPSVSDDNPFSEALFRTMKYRPSYPTKPFASIEDARRWVEGFVRWYNTEHLHSGIRFVTPEQRHSGKDVALLSRRGEVYEAARRCHPERWSSAIRDWSRPLAVRLNAPRTRTAKAVAAGIQSEPQTCQPKGRSKAEDTCSRALSGLARRLLLSRARPAAAQAEA